jgi:hypothetical protein
MPLNIVDNTAGTQRIGMDNSANVEFGSATPNSPMSVQGRPLLNGSSLSQAIARPVSMQRTSGVVTVSGQNAGTLVSCPACSGFGAADGPAEIIGFNSNKTSFTIYGYFAGNRDLGYAVF